MHVGIPFDNARVNDKRRNTEEYPSERTLDRLFRAYRGYQLVLAEQSAAKIGKTSVDHAPIKIRRHTKFPARLSLRITIDINARMMYIPTVPAAHACSSVTFPFEKVKTVRITSRMRPSTASAPL